MILPRSICAAALWTLAALSHAAGFGFIDVPADKRGPALRGAVWTPCDTPATRIPMDPFLIEGVRDCAISGTRHPLVAVSHGTGGSFLGHHDTNAALADAGFVVAAISHPGDNFRDLSGQGHLSTLASRPIDMKRLVDYMLEAWPGRSTIDEDRVGMLGLSNGGYTALVAAGADPDFTLRKDLCPTGTDLPLCGEIDRREFPVPPSPDRRIKAIAVVDPVSFFNADGLRQVRVPVQLWSSERSSDGATPQTVASVRRDLPRPPEWQLTPRTIHFAFPAPCSQQMAITLPDICRDAPALDRASLHTDFNTKVRAFFERTLMQR